MTPQKIPLPAAFSCKLCINSPYPVCLCPVPVYLCPVSVSCVFLSCVSVSRVSVSCVSVSCVSVSCVSVSFVSCAVSTCVSMFCVCVLCVYVLCVCILPVCQNQVPQILPHDYPMGYPTFSTDPPIGSLRGFVSMLPKDRFTLYRKN